MTACLNLSFFRLAEISWRRCFPLFIDILDYGAALTPLATRAIDGRGMGIAAAPIGVFR